MGGRRFSYRELDAQATRLARRLRALGVGPDARVAICCERSPELVVGVLGILKAGAAYVPLDAAHPAQRLAGMLEDSAPQAVLTGGQGHDAIAVSMRRKIFPLSPPKRRFPNSTMGISPT
jgi:non-ribosomal peptide synthetase component F